MEGTGRKPGWLKVRSLSGAGYEDVRSVLRSCGVNTVCDEAMCPNRGTCFNDKTATFMILGRTCTRRCAFCGVSKGAPEPVDAGEPDRVAEAAGKLGLRYAVVTSVTRDDLPDGGADHFYRTIRAVHELTPGVAVEALLPDFGGDPRALERVLAARPEVAGHNVETVPPLYAKVRPGADYRRSLAVLEGIRNLSSSVLSKTGLMVGLGEREDEVVAVLRDVRARGCEILTVGQYLAPSRAHYPVAEYVHPDTFDKYRRIAEDMGFRSVASGPLVRSSFLAHRAYRELTENPYAG